MTTTGQKRILACIEEYLTSETEDMVDQLVQLQDENKRLRALLAESKRSHGNDCWANPEVVGEDIGNCTCGADAWNARVDVALGTAKP